jgi:hypothetical protein
MTATFFFRAIHTTLRLRSSTFADSISHSGSQVLSAFSDADSVHPCSTNLGPKQY